MEGAGRIFAGEYCQATCTRRTKSDDMPALLSPGGMSCLLLFVAGTLTESDQKGRDAFYGRVADPTGVFELRAERPDTGLQASLSAISPPAFVTVIGRARLGSTGVPYMDLSEIREVDRAVRNLWIIRTAEITAERLVLLQKALRSGSGDEEVCAAITAYQVTGADIRALADMVCMALGQVDGISPADISGSPVKETVLTLIRESAGNKGISLEDLIHLAAGSGIDETMVRKAVRVLLEEDECYQPARDVLKPL